MVEEKTADDTNSDSSPGLLTDRQREILHGDADVSDNYYRVTVSRARKRIEGLEKDMPALDAHGDLGKEIRKAVDIDRLPVDHRFERMAHYLDLDPLDDETHRTIYERVKSLQPGDLVRFGGGLPDQTVDTITQEEEMVGVYFYDPDEKTGEQQRTPVTDMTICEVPYQNDFTSRSLANWSYGPGPEALIVGVVEDVTVSPYTGDEYDAESVADVDWAVVPLPRAPLQPEKRLQ